MPTDNGLNPAPAPTAARLTADIVAAYVSRNQIGAREVAGAVRQVFAALQSLDQLATDPGAAREHPAVPIGRSIQPDHLVCLEDGKKLKVLTRYLRGRYSLSPDEYRQRWRLPSDYPMVAPSYRAQRSALAKATGLGHGVRRAGTAKGSTTK